MIYIRHLDVAVTGQGRHLKLSSVPCFVSTSHLKSVMSEDAEESFCE